jgi:hypothetical protein
VRRSTSILLTRGHAEVRVAVGPCGTLDRCSRRISLLRVLNELSHRHRERDHGRCRGDHGHLANAGAFTDVPDNCDSVYLWDDLLEQLQPLPGSAELILKETGGVTSGSRQTLDQATANGGRFREHDWNGMGRFLQGTDGRAADTQNDVGRQGD